MSPRAIRRPTTPCSRPPRRPMACSSRSAGSTPTTRRWPRPGAASTPARAGIKLHPRAEQFTLDHPEVKPLIALAHERSLPVLIHAGRGIPALGLHAVQLAGEFPNARLILAHAGICDLSWIWRVAADHPNLLFDTAWWLPSDLRGAVLARAARPDPVRLRRALRQHRLLGRLPAAHGDWWPACQRRRSARSPPSSRCASPTASRSCPPGRPSVSPSAPRTCCSIAWPSSSCWRDLGHARRRSDRDARAGPPGVRRAARHRRRAVLRRHRRRCSTAMRSTPPPIPTTAAGSRF